MKTDVQLQKDVMAELSSEAALGAAQIGVAVMDGVVTLAGHVDSFAQKWDAERAAQRVSGVKGLAVELAVTLPGASQRCDADIKRAAENVLGWSAHLPKDAVKVVVEDGWLTLSGEVDWAYQRRTASHAVRTLLGVSGISDRITIKPTVSMGSVKADIEAALKRRAQADARHILVEVHGSDVTLSGTVHSWAERDLATHSAWGTPGVRNVVDHIVVVC
jgi:osmotically-inducible protein OsmY